jgi:hypothetical protein
MTQEQPVTVNGRTARPRYVRQKDGGFALISWDIDNGGGTIPAELFAREGRRILAAQAAGVPWEPMSALAKINGQKVTAAQSVAHLRSVFAMGRDIAYEVPEDTRRAATEELERGGQFADVVDAVANENWPALPRELFARLHGEPDALEDRPIGTDWASELHRAADESDQWEQLRAMAQGDTWAAGIGAAAVGRELVKAFGDKLRELPQEDPAKLAEQLNAADEALGLDEDEAQKVLGPFIKLAADAQTAAEEVAEAIAASPGKIERAIDEGARAAAAEIGEVLQAASALGCGSGPGQLSRVTGPRDEILAALQTNPELRRIATLAGRLKVAARAAQKSKARYVPEQIVDVTLGGEISRLLPSELVAFVCPELETLEMKRLIERQAFEYSLEGTEKKNRGPLILCVDESGSMRGAPHEFACAVALALLEICVLQKRAFAYLHFDSRVTREWIVERPAAVPFADLLAEVSYFSDGGTAFEPPLQRAAELIAGTSTALVDADVMLLTDGAATWSASPQGAVATLGQLGARLWGVEIGGCFTPEQTKAMAGKVSLQSGLAGATSQIELAFGI